MSDAAYLVAVLDTTVSPPVVKGCGIYSESAMSLTGAIDRDTFSVDVLVVHAREYATARNMLISFLKKEFAFNYSPFRWVEQFLQHELRE